MRIAVILSLVAILPLIHAEGCVPTTWDPDVDTGVGVGPRFYIEDGTEQCAFTGLCLFSIWTYEETNGIDGLQREDEQWDDTCGGAIEGDTVVF